MVQYSCRLRYSDFRLEENDMKNLALVFLVACLTACAPAAAASPTADPTATERATPAPTFTPSPTFAATSTPPPGGPCDNPLVPLAIGNHWKYRVTTESGSREYDLRVLERRDSGNILMLVEFADQDKSVQERVVCLDGAIEDFPLFVMDMLFAERLNKFMNTYHDRGLYAPSHAALAENGWALDWEVFYLTEDSAGITNPAGGPGLIFVQSSPIDIVFRMDGSREAVTVPAGEYPQALKVSHDFTVTTTVGSGGGHLIIETTHWYEPYVGLVRAELDKATLSTSQQELSVPMMSILELIEFTPGN
jgi:hypothetical protein